MQRNPIPAAVLAAALSACTLQPEALNSERIERRFGSYGIEVLDQSGNIRHSSLYSTHGGADICRTYAIVEFVDDNPVYSTDIHSKVVGGASIGATFKADGWDILKKTFYVGNISLPANGNTITELMQLDSVAELAVHAYELHIKKAPTSIHYATIIEVHHPEYLQADDLDELFPLTIDPGTGAQDRVRQLVLGPHDD
jgi:hypothetical protein